MTPNFVQLCFLPGKESFQDSWGGRAKNGPEDDVSSPPYVDGGTAGTDRHSGSRSQIPQLDLIKGLGNFMTANNICCYSNEANDRDVVIEFHASAIDGDHRSDLLGPRQEYQVPVSNVRGSGNRW